MDFLICSRPWWTAGHFSTCFQKACLELIIPSVSVALSVLAVLFYLYRKRIDSSCTPGFQPVALDDDGDEPVEFSTDQEYGTTLVITRRARLLEAIALFLDIGVCMTLIYYGENRGSAATLFLSVYLLILVVARHRFSELSVTLRSHSELLCCGHWICLLVLTYTAWTTEFSNFETWYDLIRLGLFSSLVMVHWTASRVPAQTREPWAGSADSEHLSQDETASFISRLLFAWMEPLLWEALRTDSFDALKAADSYPLSRRLASNVSISQFRARTFASTTLIWRIFHFLKWDFLKQGFWATLTGVLVFVPPVLIRLLLEYLESKTSETSTAWLYVLGLFTSSVIAAIADCQCGWSGYTISAKLRAVLLDQVYTKVMRRRVVKTSLPMDGQPGAGRGYTSDGAIYNFVSGDIDFISSISGNVYLVWVTFPVQITIGTGLLYQLLGLSGILGVILMTALLPINILVSKRLAAVQTQLLAASDARIQSSNELLKAIRIIKYYAWEVPFRERVLRKRQAELRIMRTRFIWWSISMTIFYSLPFIVTILTFFFHTIVWHGTLGTTIAFPALATFAVLRIPLNRMADSITYMIQAHVSLLRVTEFLEEHETEKATQPIVENPSFIGFDGATLTWPPNSPQSTSSEGEDRSFNGPQPSNIFQLQGLDIKFRKNTLNVICGPSGSGKSSLLLALLGEMHLEKGNVILPRRDPEPTFSTRVDSCGLEETAAYCPHEPWIMNQSIRANILLETPFNASRYEEVLQCVALTQDLAKINEGDMTLAGENGNRLSGGQKQRISLARALYSPCKYVLLDDCLSALDAHTARHIFFHGIKGRLLEGRTCILATHHTQMTIPHSDFVVILESGRVKVQGPPGTRGIVPGGFSDATIDHQERVVGANEIDGDVEEQEFRPDNNEMEKVLESGKGAVSWGMVKGYFVDMGSTWFWAIVFAGFGAQQLVSLETNLWIKGWAFQYDKIELEQSAPRESQVAAWYYLSVYATICVVYALVTLLRDLITFSGSLKASSTIHVRLLNSVTSAKLVFFERPAGQITNRFSKDVNIIDQSLATFFVSAFQIAATVIMVIVLIVWAIPRLILILILGVVCIAYFYITYLYIQGAQNLKRMEASARSPLYQQVGETIAGYISIRGYGREALFTSRHRTLVDSLNQPYLLLWASKQWLTMRVSILSSIVTLVTGIFVVLETKSINTGTAGLILTYVTTFTETMLWFIQIYAIVQQSLTSVERIAEYSSVEQEAGGPATCLSTVPLHSCRQQQGWPEKGGVTFHNFTARYALGLNPVLKSISFHAASGERIAIVGRTGAGKSSVALALLRVLEPDQDGGGIEIDDVNIASVELAVLRGNAVTIIPQEPQLFSGTVRTNLDPLGQHTDAEIKDVLHSMQKGTTINHFELDAQASDLSRGQIQLLCVARGLLRKTRILVLDEATANVDLVTDNAVQCGLRAFVAHGGTTVITIAHRLLTIADYDRVVVLDAGKVVEQGSIKELLEHRGVGTVFQSLCEESGHLEEIRRLAGI